MSRIPAHGAVVASSAISAVLALCLLGGIAAEAPTGADAAASTTIGGATVTGSDDSIFGTVTRLADGAREDGVSDSALFSTSAGVGVVADVVGAAGSTSSLGLAGTGLAGNVASEQVPASALLPVTPAPAPAVAAPAAVPLVGTVASVHVQSRSSVSAAVSGTPRDMARTLASARGWNAQQWSCLEQLWQHESMFQTTVRNTRSGAYGIPQALPASKMATAGADWRTNPVTQIQWGLTYIEARYGTACDAWSHWKRNRSY